MSTYSDTIGPTFPEPEAYAILSRMQIAADIVGHGERLVLQIRDGGGQDITADLGTVHVHLKIPGRVYGDSRGIRFGGEFKLLADQRCRLA